MLRRKRYRLMLLGIKIVDVMIDKHEKYSKEYSDKEVDNKQKGKYTNKYAVGDKSNIPDKYKTSRDINTVGK